MASPPDSPAASPRESTPRTQLLWGVWDRRTQTYHAGQEWLTCPNFEEDFSVDTNALGMPESGMKAAEIALSDIHHYPPADFEPGLTDLAQFLWPEDHVENKKRLLLGNGASELIDLVTRCGEMKGKWKPGPYSTQYKEFERAALVNGYKPGHHKEPNATLMCLVNPNVPTGHYMNISRIKEYIETQACDGSTVLVDESCQPWLGPHWREDSLISQGPWLAKLSAERNINVFVIHGWAKLWACPGIRLGSVVAPTPEQLKNVKSKQVPWSVNNVGLSFLSAVVRDQEYLNKTWDVTGPWRQRLKQLIEDNFGWTVYGEPWMSWLWIDTGDESTPYEAVTLARESGVPVRHGKFGYNQNSYIRVSVRNPEKQDILIKALSTLRRQFVEPNWAKVITNNT